VKQMVKILVVVSSIIQSQWAVQVELIKGWNLFSPLISSDTEAGTYFTALGVNVSADIKKIWAYDASSNNPWSSFVPGATQNFNLRPGMGYWVLMENAATLTLPDTFGSFSLALSGSGWHLVGVNSSQDITVDESGLFQAANFTSGNPSDIRKIWSYDGNWSSYTDGAANNTLSSITPGNGLWFLILSDFEINSQNINLSDLFPPTCPGCPAIGN